MAIERIKLRHQVIRFYATIQLIILVGMRWVGIYLNKFENKKSDDLTNLLYTLHVSAVINAIGNNEIAEHTSKDPILNGLIELTKSGKNYIPKRKPSLNPYREILSQITCTSKVPF